MYKQRKIENAIVSDVNILESRNLHYLRLKTPRNI